MFPRQSQHRRSIAPTASLAVTIAGLQYLSDHDLFALTCDTDANSTGFQLIRFEVISNCGNTVNTRFDQLAFRITPYVVPEPSTLLASVECATWAGYRRRNAAATRSLSCPSDQL